MESIGDQHNIDTPELVAIELPLAGIGSRFIAALLDTLILIIGSLVLIAVGLFVIPALGIYGRKAMSWGLGVSMLIGFLVVWGYFALLEAFNNGRTLGKLVAKIRVIHQSGRGITFVESLARNLMRFIDYQPGFLFIGFYGVGVISTFLSRRHQRLGDMVAGTLVVRERDIDAPLWTDSTSRTFTATPLAPHSSATAPHLRVTLPAPALAKLAPSDLEVLEGFFARRLDMDMNTRGTIALRIATALCAKSGLTIPPEISVETFLEAVAHQFRELGRMN